MKTIRHITLKYVISEPGDLTRYNYAFHVNADEYYFIPIKNDFRYPQHINYWSIKNITEVNDIVISIAKTFNCNPHTVMECIRTIQEDRNKAWEDI